MENTLMFKDVLWVIGAIVAVVAFAKIVIHPFRDLNDKITSQETSFNSKIGEQEETLKNLGTTLNNQQKLLNSSLKVQILLLQHTVYGNHTDAIKKKLEELESVIIDTK